MPRPGDIVSFKHHGFLFTSKKPKFPTLYRIRTDITWQDVVDNWKEPNHAPKGNATSTAYGASQSRIADWAVKGLKRKHKRKGYWVNIDNRRAFFLHFAEKMGFNPFDAKNWGNVTVKQLAAQQVRAPVSSQRVMFAASKSCALPAGMRAARSVQRVAPCNTQKHVS